jgi:O-glycosyl hydrolase
MRRSKFRLRASRPCANHSTYYRLSSVEPLERRVLMSVNVSIDATQQFQKIEGFGTAVASDPSLYESAAFQKMYYSDLGSSIVRLPLRLDALMGPGGTLDSPVTLGPDLQADISLFNFQQPDVQGDGELAAASKTYGIDSVKVIGSIWSPPNWMKGPEVNWYDGQANGTLPTITNGGTDSAGGSLIDTPAGLAQFGLYVAAYVKGFQQTYGIQMYAVNIQNELAFDESYSSCEYTPQIFVDAIKAVHNAFVEYGITTKIGGPDDVGVGPTDDPWLLWRQMQYIDAVRADPVAMADLDMYNIHGYAMDPSTPFRSPTMWDEYLNGRSPDQYPSPSGAWWTGIANDGKESWQTEMSNMPQTPAGALLMAENIQDALVYGNESAWLYWQTADGSPASQESLTGGTDETTTNFAAAQQFFRYIRPDSYRIAATPTDPNGVYVSAFIQNQQQTLTTVLVNTGTTDQTVNLSLKGANVSVFNVDRRTSATDTFADEGPVSVVNGVATITLPAGAIVTLQGSTAAATVTRVGTDTTTQGSWVSRYGSDGYDVFDSGQSLPSYAQVSVSNNLTYNWDFEPIDNRSTQTDPTSGNRINACYYSADSFTLDVNLTDGKTHQVALYMLDSDNWRRAQTVQITDANTGAILDSQPMSSFVQGKYLVWDISGHVDITIANAGGWNAVASGLFFDPAPSSQPQPAAATFVRSDTTTQGSWVGTYGNDGYDVFGAGAQLPSYAQVAASNNLSWTWDYQPIDNRSTETDPISGKRINACYYSDTSFSLDVNLTDGKVHQVALYMLDSDNWGRSQTVTITDATTGAVLDTQNVSSFVQGQYLVWDLSGHVKITLTNDGGRNAVASALLFG